MEEAKNSEPKPCRLYCENDSCKKPRKYFCSDHNEVLCNGCFAALHVRCKCDEIPDKEDVVECLEIVKTLFTSIDENSNIINARSYIKNFDDELQKTLIEGSLFTEFTKLKELKLIAKGDNLSRKVAKDIDRSSMQNELLDYKQKVFKEMEENNRNKIEKTIRELNNKIQKEEKITQKLTKMNSKLTIELKEQTKELEEARQKVQEMLEEQKLRKKEETEEEQKDRAERFSQIYEKHIGSKVADLPNFIFAANLSDSNLKDLLEDIVTSKLKLPDIKRIQIYCFSDSDKDLVDSFLNCTPNHLRNLSIHHSFTIGTPIKHKLDIYSLSEAVAAVTRQVYICRFEFSAADLQQFIRAACNTERIVFNYCSVHCSSSLDFGVNIKYNTNYLSFDCCGDASYEELSTDWISDPSCFSHIVDAIGKSGLSQSLTILNIYGNQTLKKTKMQKLLNANGMTKIKVIEESISPIND